MLVGEIYDGAPQVMSVGNYVDTNAAITDNSWKSIGREADALANGIMSDLANTFREQHKISIEVRQEVRAMRFAAGRDRNAEEARAHARQALVPLAKLIEWSAPR